MRTRWTAAVLACFVAVSVAGCGDDDDPVSPTFGDLEVSVVTTGTGLDPDGYSVAVDGGTPRAIAVNGTETFADVATGSRSVELTGVAANCTVGGNNPRSVNVTTGTVSTTFEVTCVAVAGDLEVTTTTTGDEPDDAYTFSVDGGAAQAIGANATVTLADLAPATYSVELGDVAANCVVDGANPVSVDVTAGGTTPVAFSITCSATVGALEVTAATTGTDLDPDGYTVLVDGTETQALAIDGTVTFTGLDEGDHTAELQGVAANCTVGGENPRTVAVVAGAVAPTTFDVTCEPIVGNIEVTTTTTGTGLDDAYDVAIDGTVVGTIGINETLLLSDIPVGDRSVEIQGIAATCSATTTNPETVTVTDGGTSPVAFELFCFASLSNELVFTSDRDGNKDIFFMTATGSGQANLTNDPATDANPTIAPDGAAVAFESDRSGNLDLWRMSASGFTNLTNSAATERDPSYAGDFSGIAYQRKTSTTTWQIWRINVNGSTPTQLTGDLGDDTEPAWSADGNRILFQSDRDGNADIYVMDADGANQTRLTIDPGVDGRPAWSPDGTQIAWVSDRSGDFEVWVADYDAGTRSISNLVNVTNDPANDFMPAWNGAGTQIAFASDRSGSFEVWKMNADGSGATNITNASGATDDTPAWSN